MNERLVDLVLRSAIKVLRDHGRVATPQYVAAISVTAIWPELDDDDYQEARIARATELYPIAQQILLTEGKSDAVTTTPIIQ